MGEVRRAHVHRPHDPRVADIEDVDAPGRLLEVPEKHALAGERVGENRAIDGAVEHEQDRVPARVGEEPLDRWDDAVEELADRLAAEEALLVRDDTPERMDERALELVLRDRGEARATDLAQVGPRLDGVSRRHERRGLHRSWKPARDDAVERDPAE